jgi:hypothetical protein
LGRVNPGNGSFYGTFKPPGSTKQILISGVVNQKLRRADGLFVDGAVGGNAIIVPTGVATSLAQ